MSNPQWYERLFDEGYLLLFENVLRAFSDADRDAAFVDRALALPPQAQVLDLGCGFGRHAIALAQRGYRVTGVDLSPQLLRIGEETARSVGAQIQWMRRDMRELDGLGPFDACVCLYTVFGYFDDEVNAQVIRGIHDVLAPGARLMLDVFNPLALLPRVNDNVWRETPHGVVREVRQYDALTGQLSTDRTLFGSNGTRFDFPTSRVRMYAPYEVGKLLRGAGFEIDQLYGGLEDRPLQWNASSTQVFVAHRL